MTKILHGKVHGRTIELEEDPGVADGESVDVQLTVSSGAHNWGEGLRRCAGALAGEWTEQDDRILEEIHLDRKRDTRAQLPD